MNVFKLLLVLLITALFFSCSRDEEVSGPKYATASDNLKIVDDKFAVLAYPDIDLGLGFNDNSVSFSNTTDNTPLDTVYYYAELSEIVSWQITIKGSESGAEKILLGTSKIIDYPYWTGESDNIYFFKKDETVISTLSFVGSKVSQQSAFTIKETKSYPNVILIGDFEYGSSAKGLVKGSDLETEDNDGWFQYFDVAGDNEEISYGLGPNLIDVRSGQEHKASTPVEPLQGANYFQLRGKDNASKTGSFFIGGFGHTPISYGIGSDVLLEDIFINLYVNSNGNTTTKFVIEIPGINGDIFSKDFVIDWNGWKLISIRLSDFVQTTVGDNGIGFLLPNQLKSLKFQMHSAGQSGNYAEVNIDYVTLTIGSPFKQ